MIDEQGEKYFVEVLERGGEQVERRRRRRKGVAAACLCLVFDCISVFRASYIALG